MDINSVYIQGANIFEMYKYLIFACLLIGVTSNAQVKNFSLHAGAHIPIIPSVDNIEETSYSIPTTSAYFSTILRARLRESFSDKIGFAIRTQFDYPISTQFYLSSGLSVSYIQFHRRITVLNLNNSIQLPDHEAPVMVGVVGSPFGSIYLRDIDGNIIDTPILGASKNKGKTTALSMHVPILIGTSFLKERFHVRTGAVFSYLLHATEIKQQYVPGRSFSEYRDTSKEGFNEFQAGVTVQTTYMFAKRIGVDAGAQKFLTPIYSGAGQAAGKAKYNFLSLGLCYNFL